MILVTKTCKYIFYAFTLLRVVVIHFYDVWMKSFKHFKKLCVVILTIKVIFCIVREAWSIHLCN